MGRLKPFRVELVKKWKVYLQYDHCCQRPVLLDGTDPAPSPHESFQPLQMGMPRCPVSDKVGMRNEPGYRTQHAIAGPLALVRTLELGANILDRHLVVVEGFLAVVEWNASTSGLLVRVSSIRDVRAVEGEIGKDLAEGGGILQTDVIPDVAVLKEGPG